MSSSPESKGSISPEPFKQEVPLTCTIIGSLRNKIQIDTVIERFEAGGIRVLAPARGKVVGEKQGFRVMEVDGDREPNSIEEDFITAMLTSHFVYLVNPGSKHGTTSALEFGIALGNKIPLFTMEPLGEIDEVEEQHPTHLALKSFLPVIPPGQLIEFFQSSENRVGFINDNESERQLRLRKIAEGQARRSARFVIGYDLIELNRTPGVYGFNDEAEEWQHRGFGTEVLISEIAKIKPKPRQDEESL